MEKIYRLILIIFLNFILHVSTLLAGEQGQIASKQQGNYEPQIEKPTDDKLATLAIQTNWPIAVKTIDEKARVYINRRSKFSQIPDFLQGLQYTLQHRKKITVFSCRVKNSGSIYLCLFGDKTPKRIVQNRDWKKCGTMRGPSFRRKNIWTVYQTSVHKGEILTLSQDDNMGIIVLAKEITKDETRPLPKMPMISNAQKYISGKSVENRPIEYLVFGDGDNVVFIIAAIHGHEQLGIPLVHKLAEHLQECPYLLEGRKVILMPIANPDGVAKYSRLNAHGVDLNRNFDSSNRRNGRKNGPHALSEPEARVIHKVIEKYSPDRIVSIHQMMEWTVDSNHPPGMLDYDGPGEALANIMAQYCKLPIERWGSEPGSLGSYVGIDLGIPIVTPELSKFDCNLSLDKLWKKYGNALIAAIIYPDRVNETEREKVLNISVDPNLK